jgi:hypothetical protein
VDWEVANCSPATHLPGSWRDKPPESGFRGYGAHVAPLPWWEGLGEGEKNFEQISPPPPNLPHRGGGTSAREFIPSQRR